MLAIGGECHVPRPEGPARANLGGLLAEQRGPDPELALALQGDRLEVDPANENEIPVQGPDFLGGDVERVVRMLDPLAFWSKELNRFRGAGSPGQAERVRHGGARTLSVDGHVPLLDTQGRSRRSPLTGRSSVPQLQYPPREALMNQ